MDQSPVFTAVRREARGIISLEKLSRILSDLHGESPEVAFVLLDRHRYSLGGWSDELHWAFVEYIVAEPEEQQLLH